jgi:Predicted dehydrogenases and related proteins
MIKNIAVVGCGHWGKNLIRNFSELGVLYAVCDENKELADKFADLYKVDNLNFNEIINNESIQGVVIAAPAVLHAQLAIKALSAKKHVYVEKPLSLNIHDSNEMIKTSLDNNVQLMVGHLLQYHPIFIKLLELVNLGKFGNILSISSNKMSFGKVRSEEDVIWEFCSS